MDEVASRALFNTLPVAQARHLLGEVHDDLRRLSLILESDPQLAAQLENQIPITAHLEDPRRRLGPLLRHLRPERAVKLLLHLPASVAADLVRTLAWDQCHAVGSALAALPPQRTVSVWEDAPAFLDQLQRIISECPPARVVDSADHELRPRPHAPQQVEVEPQWAATVRYYLGLPPEVDIRATQLFQQSQPTRPMTRSDQGPLVLKGLLGQMALQNDFINIVKFAYTPGKVISHQRIHVDAIAAVLLKPATRLNHGYLQIQLHASAPMPVARISLSAGRPPQRAPYSVSIRHAHNQAAQVFKENSNSTSTTGETPHQVLDLASEMTRQGRSRSTRESTRRCACEAGSRVADWSRSGHKEPPASARDSARR